MSQVIVLNHVTVDGVMQAPGRVDEDKRDGFVHGGWAMPRGNDLGLAAAPPATVGGLLFGRRTYEDFYAVWPAQTDNPFTAILNATPKYVASRTLRDPLPWSNSILLDGDAATAVAALKPRLERDLLVMGSGRLIQALMSRALIDVFILMVHPLVLGSGRRLFEHGGPPAAFALKDVKAAANGVVIATYACATA